MQVCVCMCVCMSTPRLLITSSMIWIQYDWSNEFYHFYIFYIAALVGIISRYDLCVVETSLTKLS